MEEIQPQTNPSPAPTSAPEKKSAGPIIGILIILVILIIGGWLIYGRSIKNTIQPDMTVPTQAAEQSEAETLGQITTQGSSDLPEDISNDLNGVSPETLDSGMESL